MKKAIFCAVALMFGATMFAQGPTITRTAATSPTINDSDVNQTGWLNNATISQTEQNTSTVDQEFNRNEAMVTQVGNNWSDIDQSGEVGNLRSSGFQNEATVDQDGGRTAFQVSDIDQQGDNNIVDVEQDGDDNYAKVQQGNNGNAEGNFAKVKQDGGTMSGDGNQVDVLQTYDNNYADIDQMGNNNDVLLRQVSGPNQTEGNYAVHRQDGNNNFIDSEQKTTQAAPSGLVINNYTNGEWVTQTGDDNGSKLRQEGEGNISIVDQQDGLINGAPHGPAGVSNYADVSQTDQRNYSSITQGLKGVTSDNTATVMQSGNGWNVSDITQMGGNSATVTQTNP